MTSSSHNFIITSKLGMKRSFNCPDLSSINDTVVDDAVFRDEHDYYYQQEPASKRRRADSNESSSSCSAVCYCCWEEDRTSCTDSLFLPTSSSAEAAMEPSSLSSAVHAVTPELAPVEMPSREELRVAPNVPLLKRSKDGPATAALERFMLPQKSAGRLTANSHLDDDDDEGDFAHFSFDEQQHNCDDSHSSSWSKQDSDDKSLPFPDTAVLPPPQKVDDGDNRQPRTVSFSSRMPSMQVSVSDSSWSSRTACSSVTSTDSSLLSMLSSCTLEPTTKKTKVLSIATVIEAAGTTM